MLARDDSGWMSDGCKLTDFNQTHSSCACTHLTTFGLLTNSDDLLHHHLAAGQQQQQQQPPSLLQPTRVQLESAESRILLPAFGGYSSADSSPSSSSSAAAHSNGYKLLYLVKVSRPPTLSAVPK